MAIKTLSEPALKIIDSYLHFKIGTAVCSIPYYNNKTARNKVALRAYKGKGSPQDIFEEMESLMVKNHIDFGSLTNETLKKFLVDNNLGIECSGLAYHILDAESQNQGHDRLKKHISFINCKGLFGKITCSLRPVENCDVLTFASDMNSKAISLLEVMPGDIITMTGRPNTDNASGERNHILIIHEVTYNNSIPVKISFTHSIAYPEDGIYGTGVRQGYIEIVSGENSGSEAKWVENGSEGTANRLYLRAQKSKLEVRRIKW